MRNSFLTLLLCICVVASVAAVPPVADTPTLPALAARFETALCALPCKDPKSRQWYLLRDARAIELRDDSAVYSELWRRYDDGRIDYVYLMHDERRGIEYSPADLDVIGRRPDWERIGALLSPQDLAQLTAGAKGRHDGLETQRYTGTLRKAAVDVIWIPELALPASLEYRYPDRMITVRLLQRYPGKAPVALTDSKTLAHYQLVDYADVGDMEEDPQAQRWIRKAVAAPGHQHHEHP